MSASAEAVPAQTDKERGRALYLAQTDPYFFTRWMHLQRTGTKWLKGPHHPIIADTLTRVFNRELNRVVINIPPRYSKTRMVSDWVAWCLGRVPEAEFIYTSYSGDLAEKNAWATRDIVQSDCYHEVFPHLKLRQDSQARHFWRTTSDGAVYAAGDGGTVTGYGAGKKGREDFAGALIIDDPHKADQAYSDSIREGNIDFFRNTLYPSRLNAGLSTPIVIIMQRLHERDLSGWALDGGTGEAWHHVCLPAIQDDGTALWPQMHSLDDLRQMQTADPHTFAGQYMQQPRPPGGAFFDEKNLLVPSGIVGADGEPVMVPVEMPGMLNYVFAVIDTAIKAGKEHDGTGVIYFGRSYNMGGPALTILDWDYQQIQGASLETWLPSVFERCKELAAQCRAIQGVGGAWIEDKGSGIVLLQHARNQGLDAKPIDSKLSAIDKEARCMGASPHVSKGLIKFTRPAYEKTIAYKGSVKNHALSQILNARIGAKSNAADDLQDCFTYGIALTLGNGAGF